MEPWMSWRAKRGRTGKYRKGRWKKAVKKSKKKIKSTSFNENVSDYPC